MIVRLVLAALITVSSLPLAAQTPPGWRMRVDESRNAQDPERFDVAERFRDRAGLEAHRARTAASPWGLATRHIARNFQLAEAP